MNQTFAPRGEADLRRLIAEYPLAWVVSHAEGSYSATPLPLLAQTDASGQIVALFGHFARANPHVARLQAAPRATILFSGPNGYISPAAVSQPAWAPTWNYAIAQFDVDIEFVPEENDTALRQLVAFMEADRRVPWTVERMGERYQRMLPHIVAFRAHVRTATGRFKLGQDESRTSFAEIVGALEQPQLRRWMQDFNDAEPAASKS
jgi:transcriptional regulator